jgi:hypothetical protein
MSQGFNFVVLPTADANGSPIPEALLGPVYDRAREAFAAAFGGFTESSGFGGWFNGSAVVSEPIRILESFGDDNPEASNQERPNSSNAACSGAMRLPGSIEPARTCLAGSIEPMSAH